MKNLTILFWLLLSHTVQSQTCRAGHLLLLKDESNTAFNLKCSLCHITMAKNKKDSTDKKKPSRILQQHGKPVFTQSDDCVPPVSIFSAYSGKD